MTIRLNCMQRFSRSVANSTPCNKSANLKQVLEDVVTSSFKKICHNSGNLCPRGLPGPPGRRGRKGSKGMMGQPGRSGKQGIMGPPGIGGVKGMQGDSGQPGIPGANGARGDKGDTGAPGIQGAKGSKGDTGAPGVPGAKGIRGVTGAPGIPGAKGNKGDTGAPGVPGMKGKPLFEHTIPLCGGLVTQSIGGLDAIKTVQIPNDYKLVSFDVKSLFSSIPLQLALDCTTKTAINNSIELPLPTYDLMA